MRRKPRAGGGPLRRGAAPPPFTPAYGRAGGSVTDRPTLTAALAAAVRLLLPDPCAGCGAALPPRRGGPAAFGLCPPCRGRLRRHVMGCPRCGAPLPGRRRRATPCAGCRRHPPAFALLVSPWVFAPPLAEVVHALKFRRCHHLGAAIAAPLAERLAEGRPRLTDRLMADRALVVPVPLHPWRRLRRGYDQAAEIARPLARRFGLESAAALRRRRATRPQADLPRRLRTGNVEGAFAVPPLRRRLVAGRAVLLVDDVATTGATLEAAARALRSAGARRVVALAAARTPPPGEAARTAPARRTYEP